MKNGIDPPKLQSTDLNYDRDCRASVRPAFEALVAAAENAGWEPERVAYELMYLASEKGGEVRGRVLANESATLQAERLTQDGQEHTARQ